MSSMEDRLAGAGLPGLPRNVWLEIDEAALENNLRVFREICGPAVELNAVVKADGYGHGLKACGRAFEAAGADRLCVASFDEAVVLRDAGIRIPILVLFPTPLVGVIDDAAALSMELTLSDRITEGAVMDWLSRPREERGHALTVHIEVETGLTRGGFEPDYVASVVARMSGAPRIRVGGLWTHMAMPEDEEYTARQVRSFDEAVASLRAAGLPVPKRHMAATGGVLSGRVRSYEGVRIGLGLYGLLPLDLPIPEQIRPFAERLQPALALKCRALRIERFPTGTRVSYGGRWTAQRESVIATLPVGYADAIPRTAPWGEALVRGQRVPLVGTVAMDAVMADVTDVADGLGPDDEFVLVGAQGGEEIGALELARARNTIPWEVVTGMAYRIPRVYHAASVLVGLRTLNSETTNRSASLLSSEGVHGVIKNSEHEL
jgi:alanine racemase